MSVTDTRLDRATAALVDSHHFTGTPADARQLATHLLAQASHTTLTALEQAAADVDLASVQRIVAGAPGIHITDPALPDAIERLRVASGQPAAEPWWDDEDDE